MDWTAAVLLVLATVLVWLGLAQIALQRQVAPLLNAVGATPWPSRAFGPGDEVAVLRSAVPSERPDLFVAIDDDGHLGYLACNVARAIANRAALSITLLIPAPQPSPAWLPSIDNRVLVRQLSREEWAELGLVASPVLLVVGGNARVLTALQSPVALTPTWESVAVFVDAEFVRGPGSGV